MPSEWSHVEGEVNIQSGCSLVMSLRVASSSTLVTWQWAVFSASCGRRLSFPPFPSTMSRGTN
jgi:hypothetical protein